MIKEKKDEERKHINYQFHAKPVPEIVKKSLYKQLV